MQFEANADEFHSALRAIIALSSFAKKVKDDTANPCLLTAKDDYVVLEAANYGLYIKQIVKARVKQEGSVGISASVAARCLIKETVKLNYTGKSSTISITSKSYRYRIKELKKAEELVNTGRPNKNRLKSKYFAVVTADTFGTLLSTISFKPGVKDEALRVQLEITKKKNKIGSIVLTGLDAYSFARVEATGEDIAVKKSFKAVLKTTILNNIVKELGIAKVDDDSIGEGVPIRIGLVYDMDGNPALIRFKTETFDIFHPVLSIPFDNVDFVLKKFSNPKNIGCSFIARKQDIYDAIGAVTSVATSSESIVLNMKAQKKEGIIQINTMADDNTAKTEIPAKKIKAKKGMANLAVQSKYFTAFIHLSPDIAPIKIQTCGKSYLRITALKLESSSVEFLISMVSQKQRN